MKFDIIHLGVIIFAAIIAAANIEKVKTDAMPQNLQRLKSEKILGLALLSFLWILYGFYRKTNEFFMFVEVFAFSGFLLLFVAKLNSPENKVFGAHVPGHGKAESAIIKSIKFILLTLIFAAISCLAFIVLAV